jgi:hypothetical protein
MPNRLLQISRRLVEEISKKESQQLAPYQGAEYTHQVASDLIKAKLESNSPCMIARFGSVELNIIHEYCISKSGYKKYLKYILGDINSYKISDLSYKEAYNNAGIFPSNTTILSSFSEIMLQDMLEVDILGSWLNQENYFKEKLSKVIKVRLPDLEPYYHKKPWSTSLENKNVLVIHPFADTIKEQYKKRITLFSNSLVLPEFNLITIKSIQSIAGNNTNLKDWFEALNLMKNLIDKTTFDIAIIGCGAYGFPLAAHVKRIGKKSIHLGGATQILFGIKGSRWVNDEFTSSLFNKNWVFPNKDETPKGFKNVESGCYW